MKRIKYLSTLKGRIGWQGLTADEFIDALQVADKVFLTEIDSNREKQEDYPKVSSSLITNKIKDAEIISEDDLKDLANYKDSVICFMSCASVSHLIDKVKEILK